MNTETFEQTHLSGELLEEAVPYLIPNIKIQVEFYEGKAIGVDLPASVELRVVATEPALRGATVSNVNKPATLETGLVIQVPPFINEGELIRVDTGEGKYLERVKG
jgi:elongation factor P